MSAQRARSPRRPTVDAVAALAGVGRGTVSRVINGSPQVSAQARAAVERAIAELGYVPNRAARALVTHRTDSVALVVSESPERLFGDPFLAGILRGISSELMQTPLQLWLVMARSPAERERLEPQLTSQHVDGVLLLSGHDADPFPAILQRRGLPIVRGGRPAEMPRPDAPPVYIVDVDNAGGARQAVDYLFARGRRRIGTIAGAQDTGVGAARLAGYREAVRAGGRDLNPAGASGVPVEDLVAYGDFSEDSGTAAMRVLLERHPDLDAVFVASDLMACGALRALRDAGRRVPDDVAVVGFEDAPVARHTDPPLTTVHQPVEEMGRQMSRLLITRIRRDEPRVPYVLLDTHLVPRASA